MKLNRLFLVLSFFALGLLIVACSSKSDEPAPSEKTPDGEETENGEQTAEGDFLTNLQLGTGSTGGTYYPLGQEMANVMNEHVDVEGFNVSAVSSGASVDNLAQISRGEMQLGMTVHLNAVEAYNGEADFEGAAVKNFGFMGHIYPEVMQIVTTANTGITSIADLEGANIAIGPPGSGTQAAAKLILEAYGIGDGDYTAFEEGFGDAASRLQDGTIDASFGLLGLPSGSINELATQRDVVLLSIEDEALDYIEANSGFERFEIPTDSYSFMDESVWTITAYAILVGSTNQVSEDLAYEITRALYENVDQITHDQGKHMTKENVMLGSDNLPIHPGAQRYFEEEGLLN